MENDFVKFRKNNIYLSDNDLKILKKYNIYYDDFVSIREMMFYLEEFINNNEDTLEDLEDLLIKISEYNYYFNTNK